MLRWIGGLLLTSLLIGCGSWREKADEKRHAAEVYVSKGVGYMEEKRYEQAMEDLTRALELNSNSSEAHNAMAVLYERLDKPAEAVTHYRRAVSLDENNYAALNNYSRFLCSHGQSDEGLAFLDRVIDSKLYDQPWLVLTNKGICYKMTDRLEDAEHSFRAALESQPLFAPALLEMALISFDHQQYMSTRAFLQRYAGIVPHTAQTLWLSVQTETALGNAGLARTYADQLRGRFPNSPEATAAREAGLLGR
ncbi:MAG: type IV pilus biogenesis/stability protein PilW [Methylococcaceae bacterium]|nr:MAG: type IV pilus biogenesis/stability protein PilW [Methylococcaceae bacterium]